MPNLVALARLIAEICVFKLTLLYCGSAVRWPKQMFECFALATSEGTARGQRWVGGLAEAVR